MAGEPFYGTTMNHRSRRVSWQPTTKGWAEVNRLRALGGKSPIGPSMKAAKA